MKPIEFERKYRCYSFLKHPSYTGREIKEDIIELLQEDNGFAWRHYGTLLYEEDGAFFTKDSIINFYKKFIKGKYPLLDNQEYYLKFVGTHESMLIAKKKIEDFV